MPYAAEHAARVRDPGDFLPDSFRRKTLTDGVDLISGKLASGGKNGPMVAQAYRFDASKFTAEQAQAFIARPGAADAVRLRIWDDLAKIAGAPTPPLSHFMDRARRCALSVSAA
jgi:hypothetical protein